METMMIIRDLDVVIDTLTGHHDQLSMTTLLVSVALVPIHLNSLSISGCDSFLYSCCKPPDVGTSRKEKDIFEAR